jgi:hypothetical protein
MEKSQQKQNATRPRENSRKSLICLEMHHLCSPRQAMQEVSSFASFQALVKQIVFVTLVHFQLVCAE